MALSQTPFPSQRPRTARELGIMHGHPPPPEKRPTLENWDLPPFNRWSFQNIRSLFPTVDVYRGDTPARAFPQNLQDLSDLRFRSVDGTTKTLAQSLLETYTDGFLVLHRGRIVIETYSNDMTPTTVHLSQSVSKSLIGTLAGILHGEGVFDLEAPLTEYVPELAQCGYNDATLSHALDMQSGVRFTELYDTPGSDMTRIDVASGWRPARRGEARPTIRDIILTLPKIRPHGQMFEYRSIETDVIAWALERATGQKLAELVSDRVWSKLGAERDAYFTVDSAGTALADGGFNATLRDYARFGAMILNGGRVGDETVVQERWVASFSSGEQSKFGAPYTTLSPEGAYRRQWWVHDVARGDFMARGVFGQLIYIDPTNDFLAVKLSTWPDYLVPEFSAEHLQAISAIRLELTAGA